MDFSQFDARQYPTVSVQQGYREWAQTYEDTVLDILVDNLNRLWRGELRLWNEIV